MSVAVAPKLLAWATILGLFVAGSASAQDQYPARPIKIVVPVTAGGAPDLVTRVVADRLAANLHQPVIVENKPGAGERIGAEYVFKAEPDGYTLFAAPPGSLVLSPLLESRLAYQPSAFVPVSIMTTSHLVLVGRATLPVSSLHELIEFAKANPGKLTYASPGFGTPPHLTGEMLKSAASIQTTHVPYKGLAPAVRDLLSGHVDFMFDNIGNSLPYIRAGRVKIFGVASEHRIPELPDVPTIAETFPDVHTLSWFGIVAPPKTSPQIVERLAHAIADALKQPDVAAKLRALSLTPVGSSPAEMGRLLQQERARWASVVAAAGIKPQ
jgi:tripartite-type tricarboxylate transporter receptor subunit TctC